jgi:hypothetical protein
MQEHRRPVVVLAIDEHERLEGVGWVWKKQRPRREGQA